LGIYFTSQRCSKLESVLHFLDANPILSMSDPLGMSQIKLPNDLPLLVSRSLSAFYIDLLGPLHFLSKCQKVTVCSSAKAEIYATDECVTYFIDIVQLLMMWKVYLCPTLTSYTMIIRLVWIDQNKQQLKEFVIFISGKIEFKRMQLQSLLLLIILMVKWTCLIFWLKRWRTHHILLNSGTSLYANIFNLETIPGSINHIILQLFTTFICRGC
jgi:hypothetical protein